MLSPTPAAAEAAAPCTNCHLAFAGRFCPRCGEPRVEPEHRSLRHFATESLGEVTSLDGRLARSLWRLVRHPGALTRDYFTGRRTPYLKPLQLFLLCNVVFFVAQGWAGGHVLNTPLEIHIHGTAHSAVAHRWAVGAPHRAGEEEALRTPEFERFRARFDETVDRQSRTLVFVMVPMLAGVLALLFARRRRYFVEHLVFATHFYSYLLLTSPLAVAVLLAGALGLRALGLPLNLLRDDVVTVLLMLLWGGYLAAGVRRFYGTGRAGALWGGAALALGVLGVLFAYRIVLFFTAYAALIRLA